MMTDLPLLAILVMSYKRTEMTLRTINSTIQNMQYPKDKIAWYLCDDGTPKDEFDQVLAALDGQKLLGYHNEHLRNPGQEDTYFCGKGYNLGLGICHQNTDSVLILENDWELEQPFDLVPYVTMLQEREDVGICSFRMLSVGADVHTVGHNGIHYLQYLRTTQYAYSGNVQIRHGRFTRHYGWFSEDVNPGGIELAQDDKYRLDVTDGPWIWRPVAVDPWGVWHHIGQEKSWE
jgi:hypothetical protein